MSMLAQRSLAGGEIGPELYPRCDINKYMTAMRTQRNNLTKRSGGSMQRPGFGFVGEVADSDERVCKIPFVFSITQSYVLEFGDETLRIIKNGAYIYETAQNITAITKANPGVLTKVAHGMATGDEIFISGIVGMTELNNKQYKVVVIGVDTFSLKYLDGTAVNTTAFTTYVSGGTFERVFTLVSPYAIDDMPFVTYTQSKDIMVLAHTSYDVQKLSRLSDTSWTIEPVTFESSQDPPTAVTVLGYGTPGTSYYSYWVEAVSLDGSRSYAEAGFMLTGNATLSTTNFHQVGWTDPAVGPTPQYYNIYKGLHPGQNPGFVGSVTAGSYFFDTGIIPDFTDNPMLAFQDPMDKPGSVAFSKQRLLFAGGNLEPETINASKIAQYFVFVKDLLGPSTITADSNVKFALVGRILNQIFHMTEIGDLAIFTSSGEWGIAGGLDATQIPDLKQYSYNGCSRRLAPIVINNRALYVQARGSIVREFGFNLDSDGFTGDDLTVFAPHLFEGREIMSWAYQTTPHSVLWCTLDNGQLLGLTYVKEQQIWAWHRHDTGRLVGTVNDAGEDIGQGFFEDICVIPEGNEDILYATVRRYIDGRTVRYTERMSLLRKVDIVDEAMMDSHLTYDGRDIGISMTLSGGTTWDDPEYLTLTAGSAYFTAADVGNMIHFNYKELDTDLNRYVDKVLRCEIKTYTSSTVVSVLPNKLVPVSLRNVAWLDVDKAVDTVGGLEHLEGQQVAVFADAFVVGSPNNAAYDVYTVDNGAITLDAPYSVIHVGIPMLADLETLDVDSADGETISDKASIVTSVACRVEKSRGFWAGPKPPTSDTLNPLEGMNEVRVRDSEGYDDPVTPVNEVLEVGIEGTWSSGGRVFLRNVDPIPLNITSIQPAGLFPFSKGG